MANTNTAVNALLKARFPFPFPVQKYIDAAIRSGAGGVEDIATVAYSYIIQSPEFNARFPGIKRSDGTLRIGVQDYLVREESYASTAAQYNFNLTRAQVGGLVANDVDEKEFEVRARAIQTVQTNPEVFQSLRQQVDAINATMPAGAKKIPQVNTMTDAVNFLTGRADVTVYHAYESAQLQAAAKQAGIELGGYEARQIARRTEGVLTLEQAQQHFGNIAQRIRQAGPETAAFLGPDWQEKLRIIEFGGPGRVQLALEADQAVKQAEAALKQQVKPQLRLAGGRPTTGEEPAAGF